MSVLQQGEVRAGPLREFISFFANRVDMPVAQQWAKQKKKKQQTKNQRVAAGKTLNFEKSDADVQRVLLESGKKEWEKWKRLNAAKVIPQEELDDLPYLCSGSRRTRTRIRGLLPSTSSRSARVG